jgi:hypothetical protein
MKGLEDQSVKSLLDELWTTTASNLGLLGRRTVLEFIKAHRTQK